MFKNVKKSPQKKGKEKGKKKNAIKKIKGAKAKDKKKKTSPHPRLGSGQKKKPTNRPKNSQVKKKNCLLSSAGNSVIFG
jgi:hypothetical protein